MLRKVGRVFKSERTPVSAAVYKYGLGTKTKGAVVNQQNVRNQENTMLWTIQKPILEGISIVYWPSPLDGSGVL